MCGERLEGIMLASEETYVVVGEGTTEETTTEGSTKGGESVAAQHCGVGDEWWRCGEIGIWCG